MIRSCDLRILTPVRLMNKGLRSRLNRRNAEQIGLESKNNPLKKIDKIYYALIRNERLEHLPKESEQIDSVIRRYVNRNLNCTKMIYLL